MPPNPDADASREPRSAHRDANKERGTSGNSIGATKRERLSIKGNSCIKDGNPEPVTDSSFQAAHAICQATAVHKCTESEVQQLGTQLFASLAAPDRDPSVRARTHEPRLSRNPFYLQDT